MRQNRETSKHLIRQKTKYLKYHIKIATKHLICHFSGATVNRIGLQGLLGVNQGEFFSSHSFMHCSNKSYETEWSFLNHKKGNKNLRLKDTCTFVIEKLRIKRTSSIVDVHHPVIYKFLSKLTGEQAHTEMSRREILRG